MAQIFSYQEPCLSVIHGNTDNDNPSKWISIFQIYSDFLQNYHHHNRKIKKADDYAAFIRLLPVVGLISRKTKEVAWILEQVCVFANWR